MRVTLVSKLLLCCAALTANCWGQGYEIQVYGSETVEPKKTMVELHSNFTFQGSKGITNGVYPTHHILNETIEATHGINDWSELGFYYFSSYVPSVGYRPVGVHIRPRFRVPESWKWKVGVSLSQEIGYISRKFTEDPWDYELRPIIDKKMGRYYMSFNPTLVRSIKGLNSDKGFEFSPNFKMAGDITKKVTLGLEYYGNYGPVGSFNRLRDQSQQFIPSVDIDLGPNWEFNAGVGWGVTQATDHLIVKFIIGYRFGF